MSNQTRGKHKESFLNLHLTTIISISLVLFMVGIIVYTFLMSQKLTREEREKVSITAFLNDSITDSELNRIEKYLSAAHFVKDYVYVSSDSALTEHISYSGEDPSVLLGFNPLSPTIDIHLTSEYTNVDSISSVVIPKIKTFNGVVDFDYQNDVIDLLSKNLRNISLIFTVLTIVLLFISIVLINNTVRLSIYSKRFIINTMQLVGAKNSFIRRPFLCRSCVNALIGALLSIGMLYLAMFFAQREIGLELNLFDIKLIVIDIVVVVVVSFVINLISTAAAVNRYLRLNTSQLYFI